MVRFWAAVTALRFFLTAVAIRLALNRTPNSYEMLQATEMEDNASRAAAFLEGGHGLPLSDGNASQCHREELPDCCGFPIRRIIMAFLALGKLGN
jgi:hypothetical protein